MKKGFEIQFTWIFVIIAGAIIFAFLMSVVGKQKEQAQVKEDLKLRDQLANTIAITTSSTNAMNSYEYSPATISFTCDEPESSNFKIGKKGAAESLATSVVFAQKEMSGGQMYTWTQEWLLPYNAATFTYITNKKTRYVFFRTTDANSVKIINWLLEDFPPYLEKVVISDQEGIDAEIIDKGYDATVIIQVDGSPKISNGDPATRVQQAAAENIDAFNGVSSTIIKRGPREVFKSNSDKTYLITIYPEANVHYGRVDFVMNGAYHGEHGLSYYYGKEMLLGAVFAPQKNLYQCAIRKAFQRAELVTTINYERVNALDQSAISPTGMLNAARPHCQYLYGYIKGTFKNESYPFCGNIKIFDYITTELAKENGKPMRDNKQQQFGTCSIGTDRYCVTDAGCNIDTFQRIEDNYNRLVREAKDISLTGGCPYVY